jgi:hypothetical protein
VATKFAYGSIWIESLGFAGSILFVAAVIFGFLCLLRLVCWPISPKVQADFRARPTFHIIWSSIGVVVLCIAILPYFISFFMPGPQSDKDRRKYGRVLAPHESPFCSIYVGLFDTDVDAFNDTFWRFAEKHQIHTPKRYLAYSGPPLATCENEHVMVFIHTDSTSEANRLQKTMAEVFSGGPIRWSDVALLFSDWPTNGSGVLLGGTNVQAPFTGSICLIRDNTNYSISDFRQLTRDLTNELHSRFPNHTISATIYNGDKK